MDSSYSYKQTIIPVRVRHRIRVADSDYAKKESGGMGKILYGVFVAGLALIVSLGSSGTVFLASAFEPDAVEGHVVNVTAKIEMPFQEEVQEQVVLNEILPNPEGPDSQDGLAGEWVELYNNGDAPVDVAGWYIEDASPSGNRRTISASASSTHTGGTIIGAQGSGSEWLVVFMNASVLNTDGDTVSLFDDEDSPKDSHAFGVSVTDTNDSDEDSTPGEENEPATEEDPANEGKSFARIPDGIGAWIDPVPTPGGPNRAEEVADEPPVVTQEEPIVPVEVVEEIIPPVQTGGGGAVESIAGPDPAVETPVETPVETTVETPAETPIETPAETPVEDSTTTEDPVVIEEPPSGSEELIEPEQPVVTEEPAVVPEETPATSGEPAVEPEEPIIVEETPA